MKNDTHIINKKAKFDYFLSDNLEVGLVLHSNEVKAIIEGKCNLKGSYVKIIDGELWLLNCNISNIEFRESWLNKPLLMSAFEYSTRPRKLLLHKKQINKFQKLLNNTANSTLILYEIYTDKNGRLKGTLCLGSGKKEYDKRNTIKERDLARTM